MANTEPTDSSEFVLVERKAIRKPKTKLWLALWLASLVVTVPVVNNITGNDEQTLKKKLTQATEHVQDLELRVSRLRDENVILKRSDEVSRAANLSLQKELSKRDEKIALLQADTDFYEYLVGNTAKREGLRVHSIDVRPASSENTFQYTVVLTQTIKKGAFVDGKLTFSVEGTQEGKLTKLAWGQLLDDPKAAAQTFHFRYFERLEGMMTLPQGFEPLRIHVRADSRSALDNRTFKWAEVQKKRKEV